jgi:hypothetical protein
LAQVLALGVRARSTIAATSTHNTKSANGNEQHADELQGRHNKSGDRQPCGQSPNLATRCRDRGYEYSGGQRTGNEQCSEPEPFELLRDVSSWQGLIDERVAGRDRRPGEDRSPVQVLTR